MYLCVIKDSSTSSYTGIGELLWSEIAMFLEFLVFDNKKYNTANIMATMFSSQFNKSFPYYVVLDAQLIVSGLKLEDVIDSLMIEYPNDAKYITKEEFLKVWNEAEEI